MTRNERMKNPEYVAAITNYKQAEWWEQYEERALELIHRTYIRDGYDAQIIFGAADDIRTLVDGICKELEKENEQLREQLHW